MDFNEDSMKKKDRVSKDEVVKWDAYMLTLLLFKGELEDFELSVHDLDEVLDKIKRGEKI